jgi:hypothetical protein
LSRHFYSFFLHVGRRCKLLTKNSRTADFFKSFAAKNTARGQRNFLSGIHLYVCKNSYIFFRRNYGSGNFSLLIEFQKTCRDWHILCYQEFHVDRPIPTPDSIAAFEKMLFFSHGDLKRQGSQKNQARRCSRIKSAKALPRRRRAPKSEWISFPARLGTRRRWSGGAEERLSGHAGQIAESTRPDFAADDELISLPVAWDRPSGAQV